MVYDLEGAVTRIAQALVQDKTQNMTPPPLGGDLPPHHRTEGLEIDLVLHPDEFFVSFKGDSLSGPCGKAKTMKDALIQFAGQLDDDVLYKERT